MISEPKFPLDNLETAKPSLPVSSSPVSSPEPEGSLHLWLRRVWVLLFVFVCATTGVLLLILPWRPEWTDNSLLFTFPSLRAIVANGFVRGICSGLGMLDIWIGFSEAIHYHEINDNQ